MIIKEILGKADICYREHKESLDVIICQKHKQNCHSLTAERGRDMKIGSAVEKETVINKNYEKDRLDNKTEKEQQKKNQAQSIDASKLNLCQDTIKEKQKKAMQEAMDFVKKQFESDAVMDDALEECRGQITEGKEQALEASKELKSIQEQKEKLEEEYPDKEDEAYKAYKKDLNEMESHWKKEMANGKAMIADSTKAIKSMKQEALKHHGMTDAFKAAEDTLEAASKEIMGMLVNEAKENVDEKLEDKVEKAEEAEEKKTEQEEKLKESQLEQEKRAKEIEEEQEKLKRLREKRTTPPASDKAFMDMVKQQQIRENTQVILEEQSLLPEEIKGIVVDFNL